MDAAAEVVPPPTEGRCFSVRRTVHLGECGIDGLLRLDALAGFLQDVAADDADDVSVEEFRAWLLRKMTVEVARRPHPHEEVVLTTWCSGLGRSWAERRTRMVDAQGALLADAAATWVYVSLESFRPMALPQEFHDVWGGAAAGRRVDARLRLPAPSEGAASTAWPLRQTDFDFFGHVNNTVYWSPVEAALAQWGGAPGPLRAVMEYRAGLGPLDAVDVRVARGDALHLWFTVGDDVRAAAAVEAR